MEEGVEGVSFGDSGAGSPCQELRESSTIRNKVGGASARPWMSGLGVRASPLPLAAWPQAPAAMGLG